MARVHFPMTHRFPPLCTNIPPTFQTPTVAGLVREMFLSNDARTYAQHCLALRDGDVRGDHARIACPTLLTVGDQDPVTPLSWQRQIAAGIPDSRIRIIPDTAHMTMLESPAVFNTVVLEFLATLET
jgi:3-oxoadipate enol-lactonase